MIGRAELVDSPIRDVDVFQTRKPALADQLHRTYKRTLIDAERKAKQCHRTINAQHC